jgi:hypothetical protein
VEDEDIEEIEPLNGVRWSWLSPVILATGCVGSIVGDVLELFTDLAVTIARHSVWKAEQRDFEDSVKRDIERIANA